MAGSLFLIDMLFRGVAIGCLAATGVAIARGPARTALRIAGGLFAAGVASYAVTASEVLRDALGPALAPFWLLSVMGAGLVWLFLTVLFEDRDVTARTLAPSGVLLAVGVVGLVAPEPVARGAWIVHNLIEAALALHALRFIVASWRGDLVEDRRRLRGPFLAAVMCYVVVLSGFEIAEMSGWTPDWRHGASAVSLGLFCLAGAATFLAPRDSLFGPVRRAPAAPVPADGADPQDRAIALRLDALMAEGEIWRREGLTIGALAEALAAPEHRVRRVINGVLGHRNFAAFVNARRIDAAKAALSDPANAGRTVAAIAFDLGFGSLGPFNRAFKDATGATPTEFRQQALAETPKA